jgi:hypothetical protein
LLLLLLYKYPYLLDYQTSLFLRPKSLREDARCVVLVLSCLQENLSELKKLVFRVSNAYVVNSCFFVFMD